MIAYEIRDAAGVLAAVHERRDAPDGSKRFSWRRPDGTVGLNGTPIASLPLYGIHRLGAEPFVVLVEGEKSADALAAIGIPAVATVTGAASTPGWAALAELTGRSVVLWPDADDVGRDHMGRVVAGLAKVGAASVRMIDWPDAPPHADAVDFIAAGATAADIEALILLAHEIPTVAPQVDRSGDREESSRRLAVITWPQLMAEPATPPPTIRPGVPTVGSIVVAGAPKAAKSLLLSQWALESRLPALLVIEEGARPGISYRLRVQAAALGIDDPPITVMYRQRIRLDDPGSVAVLRAFVAETRPALVILDPLNRLHSADENKPSQMTPVMDALAALAYEDGGRAVAAIHHVNKPSADRRGDIWDRLRGASSIRSGTDGNLILDGDKGDYRKLVGEFRDHEPLVEHLELDRTTLLLRPVDAPPIAPTKVDPIALREFVEERGQVTGPAVAAQFAVSLNTAKYALRALGCDEYQGVRGWLTFSLSTRQ